MYNNAPYGAFANELKTWDTKATTHFTWLQRAPLGMIETRYFRYAHLNAALARQLQKLLFKPLFVCVCVFSLCLEEHLKPLVLRLIFPRSFRITVPLDYESERAKSAPVIAHTLVDYIVIGRRD